MRYYATGCAAGTSRSGCRGHLPEAGQLVGEAGRHGWGQAGREAGGQREVGRQGGCSLEAGREAGRETGRQFGGRAAGQQGGSQHAKAAFTEARRVIKPDGAPPPPPPRLC